VDHSCYFFYSSTISHFISLIFLTPLFLSFLSVLCEPTSSFTIRQLFLICCSWSDCYRLIPSILFLIRLYLLAYHCRRNRIIPNYPTRPLAIDRQSRRRLFACIFEPNSVSLAKKKKPACTKPVSGCRIFSGVESPCSCFHRRRVGWVFAELANILKPR
jgi:hypothetical protein